MSNTILTIRLAGSSDVANIQLCAELAYEPYISRMQQKPAPMLADFKTQVAQGIVSVAMLKNDLAGYVVCYPQQHHLPLFVIRNKTICTWRMSLLCQTAKAWVLASSL